MSKDKALSIRPAKDSIISKSKEEMHKPDRFPEQRLIADIPTPLHRAAKKLAMGLQKLEDPKEKDGEMQVRSVLLKDIVIEALEDVLEKYEVGNGKFDESE